MVTMQNIEIIHSNINDIENSNYNLNNNILNSYILKLDNNIIGYISYSLFRNNSILLFNLYIDKNYRNKGLGSILLNKTKYKAIFEYGAKDVYLYSNEKLLTFYKNNEFIECITDESLLDCITRKLKIRQLLKFKENDEYIKINKNI